MPGATVGGGAGEPNDVCRLAGAAATPARETTTRSLEGHSFRTGGGFTLEGQLSRRPSGGRRSAELVQDAGADDHETPGNPVGQPHVASHRGDRVRDPNADRESDASLDRA
jgi:hypothetical protein